MKNSQKIHRKTLISEGLFNPDAFQTAISLTLDKEYCLFSNPTDVVGLIVERNRDSCWPVVKLETAL